MPRRVSSQLEDNVHQGSVVGWLPIPNRRLETNLLSGMNRGFVQTVAQALHYPHDTKIARGFKDHFKHNLTLDTQASGFRGVNWSGFRDYFGRLHFAGGGIVRWFGTNGSRRD